MECTSSQYYDSSQNKCINCGVFCLTCTSSSFCLSCVSDHYLTIQNSCENNCAQGQFGDNSDQKCKNCDISCFTCILPGDSECLSCGTTLYLTTQNKCSRNCENNQYGDDSDHICKECHTSCLTCKGPNNFECLSCSIGFFLMNQNYCDQYCVQGQYGDNSDQICKKCHTSCFTCSGSSNLDCLTCAIDLYLTSKNSCDQICHQSQYADNSDNKCKNCDSSCLSCYGPNDSECLSCSTGFFLTQQNYCIQTCAQGNYGDNSDNKCKVCDISCLTCNGPNDSNCITCDIGLFLTSQKQCTLKCSLGQYGDNSDNKCKGCFSSCQSCNGYSDFECLTCTIDLFLTANNSCSPSCPNGQYGDVSFNKCMGCQSSCLTCDGPLNSNCLVCNSGYSFKDSICFSKCYSSQYFDENTQECKNCSSSCFECNGPLKNQCLSCKPTTFLKNNTCVNNCDSNEYTDITNNQCNLCDITCKTCSGPNNSSCKSCYINKFLLNKTCLNYCPSGYSLDLSNEICLKIQNEPKYIKLSILEINNPYKFLLVFISDYNLTFSFAKNIKQELSISPKIEITNYTDNYTYNINPSGINSSSFLLEMTYLDKIFFNNSSLMKITFLNSNNPDFIINQNISLKLLPIHNCETYQYFMTTSNQCISKLVIDYSYKYASQANIINLEFANFNPRIGTAILNESLLLIKIDGFVYITDYLYTISTDSNIIILTFLFKKQIINGASLQLSYNPSIIQLINYLNLTAQLQSSTRTIKLPDYYFLSTSLQATINQTRSLAEIGTESSTIAVYASLFLSPGSSFAIRGMLLLNIIKLLRFVDMNFPPHVLAIFHSEESRLIIKDKLIEDHKGDESVPTLFVIYDVSGSLINNLSEDFIMLIIILFGAIFIAILVTFKFKMKFFDLIIKLFKSIFIWSMTIMILLSKYIKVCLFLFLFLRYNQFSFHNSYDLISAIFCLFYVICLPIHIYLLINKILLLSEHENNAKIYQNVDRNTIILNTRNKIYPSISTYDKTNDLKTLDEINFEVFTVRNSKIQIQRPLRNSVCLTLENFFDMSNSRKSSGFSNFFQKNSENLKEKEELGSSQKHILTSIKRKSINNPENTWKITEVDDENNISPKLKMQNLDNKMEFNKKNAIINNEVEILKEKSIKTLKLSEKNFETPQKGKINQVYPLFEPKKLEHKPKNPNILNKYGKKILAFMAKPFISFIYYVKSIYNPKDQKDFCFKYRILIKGLKKKDKFYFFIDLLRYFALTFSVVMLMGFPILQVCFLEATSLFFLLYIVIKKPFESKIDLFFGFIKEGLVNCAFICAIVLAVLNETGDLGIGIRMDLGWGIIFAYLSLMYSLICYSLVKIGRIIYILGKMLCKKSKKNEG